MCCAVPNSVLFLGRPGVGKTTVIREMARVLADDLRKRVVSLHTYPASLECTLPCWKLRECKLSSDSSLGKTLTVSAACSGHCGHLK